ncbi:MAG TPA: FTR1 family protein [Longimicrobiales bacterium]|nr:FTR1 family protein [Longimicrobiales bacterium]
MFRRVVQAACMICGLLLISSPLAAQQPNSAVTWLDRISKEVRRARALALANNLADAQNTVLRVYLDEYEPLEQRMAGEAAIAPEVTKGEQAFHTLMRSSDASSLATHAAELDAQLARIKAAVEKNGVELETGESRITRGSHALVPAAEAKTPEIRAILQQLNQASQLYARGDHEGALTLVEHAYLERFEPIESRLPSSIVDRVEKTIHLQVRPAIKQQADAAVITSLLGDISQDLQHADQFLAKGGSAWFAVVNSFVIVVREGLEAVLLIAALLTYLTAIGAEKKHRRQIYAGMGAGVVASMLTWFVASTLLPITGANRELLEGFTALASVAVLLYVAHWLFQKTYIHDWKDYLRNRLGGAVTRGSAMAMATLAFAAVYREGFETVLFYQALAFDSGVGAVLAGFIPGALVIAAIGFAIIRAGMKLPLKKVFAGTNAVLMYLAFVFIGKGLYNLQEGGLYSPHPLPLPDHPALRQLLGFYPLIETIAAQLVFVVLLVATYVYYRRRIKDAPGQQNAQPPAPPAVARPA